MAIYPDLDDRNSDRDFVERCRRDFVATGNPLYAWEAWGMVRLTWRAPSRERLEIPEWLADYFDACARRLIGLPDVPIGKPRVVARGGGVTLTVQEKRAEVPAEPGEGPGRYGEALGFERGLAKAREAWGGPHNEEERLAAQAVELMWEEGLSLDAAAGVIADEPNPSAIHLPPRIVASRAKVKRAVTSAQRFALRTMQDRLREATGEVPSEHVARAYSDLCRRRGRSRPKSRSKRRR